ncbi:hypothetical protein [Spirosoma rhododendri]|uniref:Uncharacterized protein n=1 Tax=Spirosoma rhododendri TaxID=2728024 RepID=A0A7L5DT47_9BACT|nr:hypothetical protein [Spirosoma rhododendri]QJD80621.1 hypothetical protein HH216_21030 [Spirosoma rhododendri]
MRYLAVFGILLGLYSPAGYAQTEPVQPVGSQPVEEIESASSDWQRVSLSRSASRVTPPLASTATSPRTAPIQAAPVQAATRSTSTASTAPVATPSAGPGRSPVVSAPPVGRIPAQPQRYRPAFTGDFATNRNGWKGGRKGGYHYQIGFGRYNIRPVNPAPGEVAYSVVPLPTEMNLNLATHFTIKLDVVADSGRVPTGGLLFGVRDSLNLCAFLIRSDGTMALTRLTNGQAADSVMTADYFKPGVSVAPNRNQLVIRRVEKALHVYINQQEVRGSPFVFALLPGNSIGVSSSGSWTSFQKLIVTLGPDDWVDR